MNARRKVNFFEMKYLDPVRYSTKDYLEMVFLRIQEMHDTDESIMILPLSAGDTGLFIDLTHKVSNGSIAIRGKARFVKYNEFPDTFRKRDRRERNLGADADEDEGVVEESHFAIDSRYGKPIIGIETVRSGPKYNHIRNYIEIVAGKLGLRQELEVEPIIGQSAEEFISVMKECASFEMKVKKDRIPNIEESNEELATMLYTAQTYGDTEYVSLNLGYDFRVKKSDVPDTRSLIKKVKELLGIQKKNPNFFSNFETLQIRAKDVETPLQIYDLIADRTAAEVLTEKRNPRSRYYNSYQLCDAIYKEIGKNFGSP